MKAWSTAIEILALCLGLATCSYVEAHNAIDKQRFELEKARCQ